MAIIRNFTTAEGKQVEARVIELEADATEAQVGLAARAISGLWFGQTSDQLPLAATAQMFSRWEAEIPPVALDKLVAFARSEPTHRACCNTKASAIAGQGYRIRPASELVLSDQSAVVVASPPKSDKEPDLASKQAVLDFLESGLPDHSFTDLLIGMQTDQEVLGQGFIEVSRGANGKPDTLYPCKGVTVYMLLDGSGYVQVRGGQQKLFAKYNPGGGKTVTLEKLAPKDGRRTNDFMLRVKEWGGPDKQLPSVLSSDAFGGLVEQTVIGSSFSVSTNELLAWKKYTPLDTNYGESDIIAALYDAVGGQLAALFNMEYFKNSTIPRMAIIAKGGTMSNEVIERIEKYIGGRTASTVQNQVLLIDFPDENVELSFEKLGASQLNDSSFNDYRGIVDAHIRLVHRTPLGMLLEAGDDTADFRFISQVVRPAQRGIEARFNHLFAEDLGIKDLVLDLNVPDILGEAKRAEIFDILLRRGVVTINEVRTYMGLAPVEGGDIPFVLVPGAGLVPASAVNEITEAIKSGAYKVGDVTASSGQKTPPTGAPLFEPSKEAVQALRFELGDLSQVSPEVQRDMAVLLEQMWVTDPQMLLEMLPEACRDNLSS